MTTFSQCQQWSRQADMFIRIAFILAISGGFLLGLSF
jgi:hypothetical protein